MSRKKSNNKNKTSGLEKFLKTEITNFLKAHQKKSYTIKQISVELNLFNDIANSKIRKVMDQLADDSKIKYLEKGRYQYGAAEGIWKKGRPAKKGGKTLTGKIQITKAGFGFLLMDEDDDIFIGPNSTGKAMDGDTVKVRLMSGRRRGKASGEVLEVLERNRDTFVGNIEKVGRTFFLVTDDLRGSMEFSISPKNLKGAESGDKVLTRLLHWDKRSPEVEVIQVIGKAGEHDTEMHAILLKYGFDPSFPHEVEAEAEAIVEKISQKEISKRKDYRDTLTFTIDPTDAKDFDDAISFKKLDSGLFEVGVHIADVAHYVTPGSAIDKEALKRGTSVYLVDRTVPMLPEKLSNKVCSLRPKEDKLTFSAVFQMDESGKVYKRWFGRTVIHSNKRFHYAEAEDVLKGVTDGPFAEELLILNKMAYALRKQRFASGSIDFDSPEVKFVLDENGKPIKVIKKIRGDSNRLIEDFMLLANREVAYFVGGRKTNPIPPFVYRIHDKPNAEKLSSLQKFVAGFGYKVRLDDPKSVSKSLNKLITMAKDKPEKHVIETITIRSMAKAIYTTQNIGHYGLGFPFYTHFTSPIRRYPDMLVHRLLDKYLAKQFDEDGEKLEKTLQNNSDRERVSTKAERESIKYKQVEFLAEKIGEEYTGVISGVIEAGIFVELDENLCEGMVPVWSMDDDQYNFVQEQYAQVGRRSGKVYRLGDPVKVRIVSTDLRKRNIDMEIA